jgi:hypothetical protein
MSSDSARLNAASTSKRRNPGAPPKQTPLEISSVQDVFSMSAYHKSIGNSECREQTLEKSVHVEDLGTVLNIPL